MLPRAEKKQQTRQALMDATLDLMEAGGGFCALSLREVTRQAGVVPAAFYRHFDDMETLGLALVTEVMRRFRTALRDVRHNEMEIGGAIEASVQIFLDYVEADRRYFMFLAREQYGGMPAVRKSITDGMLSISQDLASDLRQMPKLKHLEQMDLDIIADLVVKTVYSSLPDVLDPPQVAERESQQPKFQLVQKLRFILVGAKRWRGINGTRQRGPRPVRS